MKWDNLLFSALQQKFSLSLSCEEPTFVQNQPWNSATLSSFRFHTNPLISPGMISMKQSSFKVIGVSKLQRWFLTFLSTFRSNTNPSFILIIKNLLYNVVVQLVSSNFSLTCLFGGCLLPNVPLTAHLRFFKIYSSRLIPLRYTASCKVNYDTSL